MSLYSDIQRIHAEIFDTERLLKLVESDPFMSESLQIKLEILKTKLDALPKNIQEAKVDLLFSGKAVSGSEGVRSDFIGTVIQPFQEMVRTQAAKQRFGDKLRKNNKTPINSELYLTAVKRGSFGVELSQLEQNDLFDAEEVSKTLKEVINFIQETAKSDASFESVMTKVPRKNLVSLKKFLRPIIDQQSVLKIESGDLGLELSKEEVLQTYNRVSATQESTEEIFAEGVFRGLLLDSGRFEFIQTNGDKISGYINEELPEETLIDYDKNYLNKPCVIHIRVHRTIFATGNKRSDNELLGLEDVI